MIKVTIRLNDDLDDWIAKQAEASGQSKPAKIAELLEAARQAPPTTPTLKSEPISDGGALRKIAVTLDLLFQKHLADHPRLAMTDHEKEVAEERWETVVSIRNALLK